MSSLSLTFLLGLVVTVQSHDSLPCHKWFTLFELCLVSVSSLFLAIYVVLGDPTG
jgi:hypothetical protein